MLFNFSKNHLTVDEADFLHSIGEKRRKELLKCFRPKYTRISNETKKMCEGIQNEFKTWQKVARGGRKEPPKWLHNFEEQIHKKIEEQKGKKSKKPVKVWCTGDK